jgi:hypothetical protein
MKAIHISALGASVALVASALLANGCENVPQPKIGCTIGQGPFAVKYTPKVPQTLPSVCAANKGETISVRDYTDSGKNYIAIRSSLIGAETRTDPNPDHKPYSFGEYPFESNAENFCEAGTMSPTIVQVPADATRPAVDRRYEWSNVKFLNTPRAAGTQMSATLKFTDNVAGCSLEYDVVGMWPALDCSKVDPGTGLRVPDENKCATVANADAGVRVACSSAGCVSPDFRIHCDPDILLCVLDQPPPSLK